MHGEEITDESRRNNNNDNIYVQFAAVYTTVKGEASSSSSSLLTSPLCSLSAAAAERASERAGERASGPPAVHPSSPVVPLVAINMCKWILRRALMFPLRCYHSAYIWPGATAPSPHPGGGGASGWEGARTDLFTGTRSNNN